MIVGASCVATNAPWQGTKSLSRIGLEDLSRPADARQQPSHDSVVRLATAALKLVLLDGPFGEGRGLICRLSLVLRKRHPLANDFPTRLVVFHVRGSLGCNFSTRLQRPLLLLPAIAAVSHEPNHPGLAPLTGRSKGTIHKQPSPPTAWAE